MTSVVLQKVQRTCIVAPIQWDAWDAEGNYYYLRHRHGRGRIEGPASVHFDGELDFAEVALLTNFLRMASAGGEYGFVLAEHAEIIPYCDDPEEDPMTAETVEAPRAATAPAPILEGSFAFFQPQPTSLLLVWRRKEAGPGLRAEVRALAGQMVGNLDSMIDGFGQELLALANREAAEQDHYMPVPPMVIQMAAQVGGLTLDDVVAKISKGDLS